MEQKANDFLERQPIGALMKRYAIPCVISLLVAAPLSASALNFSGWMAYSTPCRYLTSSPS